MIVKEFYRTREDGISLYRTYSTEGLKLRKVGTDEIYDEAIDIDTVSYKYEETDEFIEHNKEEE
jgi:hypothetical protein